MKKKIVFGFSLLLQCLFCGNTFADDNMQKIYSIDQITGSNIANTAKVAGEQNVSEMRKQAIIDIASSLGMSAGLAARMQEIEKKIKNKSDELDKIYNFSALAISNGVLPPVLEESNSNYNQDSNDEVRISDVMYKIYAPARFVSVYPTWRDYLVFNFSSFDLPEKSYMPKNDAEKAIWDEWVKRGWEKGKLQADNIFENSWGRLNRDYTGMIKYKMLLTQGVITKTIVAKANLGVTGDGNKLSINDQVIRITDHSQFNQNDKEWKYKTPISNPSNTVKVDKK